jgi:hypothetical protein
MARRRITTQDTKQPLFPCRYCLDEDIPENLISPCICQGTLKYVHNRCLYKWYTLNPEIGLNCSICKTECAYQNDQPIEKGISLEFTKRTGLEHPFLVTFFYHWIYIFFCLATLRMETFHEMRVQYSIFQVLFSGMYLSFFSLLVWRIQQKRLYMQKWFCTGRAMLPLFHLYCIWLVPKYTWIGGVAGNLCCFQYFYMHTHILEEMNGKTTFRFITRQPERLRSSSEPS